MRTREGRERWKRTKEEKSRSTGRKEMAENQQEGAMRKWKKRKKKKKRMKRH